MGNPECCVRPPTGHVPSQGRRPLVLPVLCVFLPQGHCLAYPSPPVLCSPAFRLQCTSLSGLFLLMSGHLCLSWYPTMLLNPGLQPLSLPSLSLWGLWCFGHDPATTSLEQFHLLRSLSFSGSGPCLPSHRQIRVNAQACRVAMSPPPTFLGVSRSTRQMGAPRATRGDAVSQPYR